MSDKNTPTMADVAREAGVALGTVSRVINGKPVGRAFRNKVEKAIDRLGYQYNNNGRTLRTGKTNTIAFIVPNTINPYFALLVHYVNIALEKRNCKMLLCFTEYDTDREAEFIQMARQKLVDGIIALTYNPRLTIPAGIPFVTIDRFFSSSVPCVASDNYGGGQLAARRLKELGCTNVAFIRIGSALTNEPSKRKDGFVSACTEMGLPFEILALEDTQPLSELDRFFRDHMTDNRLAFDGLFVGTDYLAWQVIRQLRKAQIRVPEDVQVIGFDGIRAFGDQEFFLSTIVQPVQEIAETCVNTVLSRDLASVPSLICLSVRYACGGTTKE